MSSAATPERYSFRNTRIRSRASGGTCGRLGGRGQRGDHVELASAGDLGAARDVDRAQLDRRPRERADDGRRVGGVGQQPQPGEHVPDLGALEERGLADEPVGHGALLERHGDGLALARDGGHEHGDPPGLDALACDQPLDVGGDRLGLGAVVGAAPERDLAAARRARRSARR